MQFMHHVVCNTHNKDQTFESRSNCVVLLVQITEFLGIRSYTFGFSNSRSVVELAAYSIRFRPLKCILVGRPTLYISVPSPRSITRWSDIESFFIQKLYTIHVAMNKYVYSVRIIVAPQEPFCILQCCPSKQLVRCNFINLYVATSLNPL